MVELSVVVPVYGCAECLAALHERLVRTLETTVPSFELVFVDDRSPDGSWEFLGELAEKDERVRAIRLSRNFGQHAAITAGLAERTGRWTVVMDCDLQDPPEEIPRLLDKAAAGYEIVLSKRVGRRQSWHRRVAARAYFRMRNFFMRMDMSTEYSSLSLLSRKVVDAFLQVRDRDRQYMLIVHWLGFERAVIEIEHADRMPARARTPCASCCRSALRAFLRDDDPVEMDRLSGFRARARRRAPRRLVHARVLSVRSVSGLDSVAVLLLLVGGFIITSLGVTGLYVGKIFGQVKDRPCTSWTRSSAGADELLGSASRSSSRATSRGRATST